MDFNKNWAIAFKYCAKGCGKDYYYGYSVEQTVGCISHDAELSQISIILFDNINELLRNSTAYNKIIVVYLFRSVYINEIFPELKLLYNLSKGARKFITIAGGAHPSGDPIGTLKFFDYVIVGDCELALLELLKEIILNNNSEPYIKGVWYRVNEEIKKTGRAKYVNLNDIPPFAEKYNLFAPIEITRGCPWGCKFCPVTYIYGAKCRHREIDEIIRWTKVALKHGRKVINFLTPNGFAYGSKNGKTIELSEIEELLFQLSKLKPAKIIFGNYLSNVRPDFVIDETVKLVRKYTCTNTIHMGGQSGSNKILRISKVGYKTEDILNAVDIVKSNNLHCSVDIIFGLPGEDEDDRRQTINFINKLIDKGAKPRIHAFMPLPGTPFYKYPPGIIPNKYKKVLRRFASQNKLMAPFEYEENYCRALIKGCLTW